MCPPSQVQADYQMTPKATSAEALEAETKTGVNLDITKMTDPQANHYEATTDINVKIMEALEGRLTEGALQPSHIYTTYQPAKVGFLTFLPESCARILIEDLGPLVVASKGCTYRLTARSFETVDFDKRSEKEGQNYGHVVLREGYPPDAKTIKEGATAHLDSMGLKFNSIHNRTDEGGFPTREWRIGWTVTERFSFPEVARISNMKVGRSQYTTSPTHDIYAHATRTYTLHMQTQHAFSPAMCAWPQPRSYPAATPTPLPHRRYPTLPQSQIGGVEMLFKPSPAYCAEMGLHAGRGGCYKFLKTMRMNVTRTCQCNQTGTGAGSSSGGKAVKRTAQEAYRQRSKARVAPQGF